MPAKPPEPWFRSNIQVTVGSDLRENLLSVEARIRAACARAGRDPAEVRLVWVSKNHPQERLVEALALGARYFGENRVQEVLEKFPLPGSAPPPGNAAVTVSQGNTSVTMGKGDAQAYELHFIGRLQKNKIRKVLPLASAFHSIDSLELLEAVDRIAGELGVRREVFLQVNPSREPAKGGFEPESLPAALSSLPPVPNLRIIGMMTMGPIETPDGVPARPEDARRCFRELRSLLQAHRTATGPLKDMAWLSMGMTGDFEIAIEEGAHFIRVGTGLFGSRPGSHPAST